MIGELALRYEGLRVGRSGRVFEALVPAVLEQKVVGREAHRAWRYLLGKFGAAAPGPAPAGMRVFPSAPDLGAHSLLGLAPGRRRGRAGPDDHHRRGGRRPARAGRWTWTRPRRTAACVSLPGIGAWTSAEIRQRAMGDPDAVSVGDYHLPNAVGWTLARRTTDDDGMLELLAPYAGHRYRVTRLIELGGSRPPRRGPRMPVRDYRAF